MPSYLERALRLMDEFLDGRLPTEEFCSRFEQLWNFDRDDSGVTPWQRRLLEQLFDTVAWYSPVEADRRSNPAFKDDASIQAETRRIRDQLVR